jgi:hypothetical protein
MSNISLTDQMGAMALVDELRHQQKQVQEHLDLPRRRADIAGHIRAYYQSNNLEFDDELIEQGVHQFFAHRLMFELPQLNSFDTWLVRRLANRPLLSMHGKKLFSRRWVIAVALAAGITTLVQSCNSTIDSNTKVREVTNAAYILRQDLNETSKQLDVQRKKLVDLLRRNAAEPDANASRLLHRAEQTLPVGDIRTDIGQAEPITRDNVDTLAPQVEALEQEKLRINRALYAAERDMGYASGVLNIRQGIKAMLEDPGRAAAIAQSSGLDDRLAELDQQLARVDDYDSFQAAFASKMDLGSELFATTDLLKLQTSRYYTVKRRVEDPSIPNEVRTELQGNIHDIEADLKRGDSDAAEKKISLLIKRLKVAGYWSRY